MYDVLIVGGGMVGASLAVALKPLGLRVAMVEAFVPNASQHASYDERSIALSYGSSRIYQGMGVWDALKDDVEAIQHIHVSDRGYFGATRLSAAQENVPALGYVVASRVLGTALYSALQDGAVDLHMPAKVQAVEQHADHVDVHIVVDEQTTTLQAKLLVVADGAQSQVRAMLGIGVQARAYGQTAVISNVSTRKPPEHTAYERFTANGPLALLPMTGNRYSLVWTHSPEDAERVMALDDADFLAELQQAFGYRQGSFTKVGARASYPLSLIKSERETAARAVVIGNASHSLHPVAGQGLNLSLRDVAVLVDLLAQTKRESGDCGTAQLLQDYEQARKPDYDAVLTYTDSLVRVFSQDFAPLGHVRAGGLLTVDRVPPLRKLLTRQSMGLRFRQARLARGLTVR